MSIYPNEEYVAEILRYARPGMSQEEFNEYVQRDLNAGYRYEVEAARIAYFKKQSNV